MKIKYFIPSIAIILIAMLFVSCDNNTMLNYEVAENTKSDPLEIDIDSIEIIGDMGNFDLDKTLVCESRGVQIIVFTFTADKPSELNKLSIKLKFPSVDINGYWNPNLSIDKVNYWYSSVTSKASRNAPVLSFYNNNLDNRITIALSDALNHSEIVSYIREEDVHFYPTIKLFGEKMPKTTFYEIGIRIDTRDKPYYEVIDGVANWWAQTDEYKPMNTPPTAKNPMYSTWYSYHQSIKAEELIAECKIAKTLGCEAIIIDDGWQTMDANRGYAYTGDWEADRIPDMKGFVEDVHNEGMQLLLWYSLPFMGEKAKNYDRFKGKFLTYWESQGTYVLDPRYPETREFIIGTYVDALNKWNLDGFKLDFIGRFTANSETILTKEDGRDFASVNDATDFLMTEITNKLTEIKPDILIEFRQPYIGPLMRKYGNMFRGVDAPNNAVANRLETTNLRILSQNTAVHSDMFIWRKEESVEKAALQILNILYSVPQLSVRLEEIPETHLDMIRFWFAYWNANKDILLDGEFIPSNPGSNYPILTAIKEKKQISTLYEDIVLSLNPEINEIDIVNAKSSKFVAIKLESDFVGQLVVKDCMGSIIVDQQIKFRKGIVELKIPESGLAKLIRDKK